MFFNTVSRSRFYDYFLDYCHREGLDPDVEDFEAWMQAETDEAIDSAFE